MAGNSNVAFTLLPSSSSCAKPSALGSESWELSDSSSSCEEGAYLYYNPTQHRLSVKKNATTTSLLSVGAVYRSGKILEVISRKLP